MPFAVHVYYQAYNEGKGAGVVLLHGAGGSHLSYPPSIRRLSGFHIYALDLPGHGKSGGEGERSIEAYGGRVLDWMRAAGLEAAVIAGHSMGGAIAQTLAIEAPESVLGLVLIGTGARLPVNPQLLAEIATPETYRTALGKIIAWSFDPSCPPRLMELVAKRMAETRPEVLVGDFIACDAFDLTERVSEIKCPTLVICGENDKMTPPRNAHFLTSQISGADLEIIPQAGHMVMLEKPQAVASALARFLTKFSP